MLLLLAQQALVILCGMGQMSEFDSDLPSGPIRRAFAVSPRRKTAENAEAALSNARRAPSTPAPFVNIWLLWAAAGMLDAGGTSPGARHDGVSGGLR